MSRRHKWVVNPQRKRNKYCSACGLGLAAEVYTYLSPRNGYRKGWHYTWYKLAKVVGRGQRIPLPCDKARIAPEPPSTVS
jgi:hypothetical protein